MKKQPAKLVLRREQVRILNAKELQHAAGGYDSNAVNCPLSHPPAVPPTPGG